MNEDFKNGKIGVETRFSSTNQPDPSKVGRKKNRFKELAGEFSLSSSDFKNVLKSLLSYSADELKEIVKKKDTPVLIIAYAAAIIDEIKNGNISKMEKMIDRLHGKASENIDLNVNNFEKTKKELNDFFKKEGDDK